MIIKNKNKLRSLLKKLGIKSWLVITISFLTLGLGVVYATVPQLFGVNANAPSGSIVLSGSTQSTMGEPHVVGVLVNTAGEAVVGIDTVLRFSPAQLRISAINLTGLNNSSLRTLLPQANNIFQPEILINSANTTGELRLSALAYDMNQQRVSTPFSVMENYELYQIVFEPLQVGEASISLVSGSMNGVPTSVMASSKGDGSNVLGSATGMVINVTPSSTPTPTPLPSPVITPTPSAQPTSTPVVTPTPRPSPSITPTPTPIPTPSSTPIITPTPSPVITPTPLPPTPQPSGVLVKQTYRVTASAGDVNQDGSGKLDSTYPANSKQLWIGNGGSQTESFTGLQFSTVKIPKNAQIKSAKIRVRSVQNSWISISLRIRGVINPMSQVFSNSNLPSAQRLTSASAVVVSNVQWKTGVWYQLGDVTSVVQEVVKNAEWQSGKNLGIIIEGRGDAYGRHFVHSMDSSKSNAPQLVVEYYQ